MNACFKGPSFLPFLSSRTRFALEQIFFPKPLIVMLLNQLFRARTTRHTLRLICCSIFIIAQSMWFTETIVSQTITDPSKLDASYDAGKLAMASQSFEAIQNEGSLKTGSNHPNYSHSSARAGCSDPFIPLDG